MSRTSILLPLLLGFSFWWLLNRRLSWRERLLFFAVAILGGVATAFLSDPSVGVFGALFMAPPIVLTTGTAWLVVAGWTAVLTRQVGLLLVLLLSWGGFNVIRVDGIDGEQVATYHWRWTPTSEERYLAERAQRGAESAPAVAEGLSLRAGDWPAFRGPGRDGVCRGITIATDWKANPPKLVWRQRVGPGWSSMAVVDGRLFTQEQRGPAEAVVCLDADSGKEIWAHEDAARFEETVAGAGPRATPTFVEDRIYSLGATGVLNCLDAASGALKWRRDVTADSGAKPPMWGYSSSPLVVGGVVVVFAAGKSDRSLLAYRVESGELAWAAPVGEDSYSSPQRAVLDAVEQVLFWGDRGLIALNPISGEILWRHDAAGAPRSLQPQVVGEKGILVASENDLGTALLDVKRDGSGWSATEQWASRSMKSSFNDFVVHDGSIYGFDGAIFCCIDAKTGERRWKDGRYGHGQVLLLADQGLLVVTTEKGEVVLLAADPEEHRELGRFKAIEGKTWNHPALAQGRLYLRNGGEIACYQLGSANVR